jgi:hypothetical protein
MATNRKGRTQPVLRFQLGVQNFGRSVNRTFTCLECDFYKVTTRNADLN